VDHVIVSPTGTAAYQLRFADGGGFCERTGIPVNTFQGYNFTVDLTITMPHPTSTAVNCTPSPVVASQHVSCTATVTDMANSGQTTPTGTVSFSSSGPGEFSGGGNCTLVMSTSASASCPVTYTPGATLANPDRSDTMTATYNTDQTHTGSQGTTAVTVISPTTLARGSFVIGDENVVIGRAVTFWSSRWWKLNSLSAGPAPASFKGFANGTISSPPRCGQAWTTRPGNGSDPPPTVPEFIYAVASSSVTKAGSSISGNAEQVVVVKTNTDYSRDSGRAVTGTVVARVCSS
jgi:hypothetical protein